MISRANASKWEKSEESPYRLALLEQPNKTVAVTCLAFFMCREWATGDVDQGLVFGYG